MRNILVPTDFSENAFNALKYGLVFFKKAKCTFYLLHVSPVATYTNSSIIGSFTDTSRRPEEDLLKERTEDMQNLLNRVERLGLNVKHTFVPLTRTDFLVNGIKSECEDRKIDLIIMGTKGASGLKKVALGSNTGEVITKIKCPLLAVPEEAVFEKPKEIAFATDFQLSFDLKVLDTLIAIATLHGSAIRILHISKKGSQLSPDQNANKEFLDDYLNEVEHSFHFLTGTKLEAAVQCFTESRDIEMIAMVAKNLNFFQRVLFRPTVEEISYHTKVPFLVLHE